MQRGNGAVIGKQNTPTTSVATGVWALNEVQRAVLNGTWPAAAVSDPYFENVTMLLHGDGTNGAQNNTFLDSSTNNFTITRNGNTTQGTFTPYGSNWSNYFDGSSNLSYTDSSQLNFGTGSYTIEFWINGPSNNDKFILGNNNTSTIQITTGGSASTVGALRYVAGGNVTTSGSVLITDNAWHHCAIVRNGSSNVTLYVDGVSVGTGTDSTNYTSTTSTVTIAKHNSLSSNYLTGYLSNLRILKGTALYTANFTPPVSPLTAISGTSLLTCQSNRFVDNSSSAFTLTVTGSPSVQRFSPFAPTAPYAAGTDGGSGYFDGSGDYLAVANDNVFDTNSTFTLECWYYQPASGNATFFSRGGGTADWNTSTGHQFLFFIDAGTLYWMWNNSGTNTQISTTAPSPNQWHHIAVGYNGTTTRFWLNGASVGSSTTGYTLPTTRNIIRAGLNPSNQNPLTGYLSGLRFVKGTDVYGVSNTSITVPTAPLTAITNTSLLLNFTNAGIIDNAEMNNLETVGNAQISTAQSKFGGASMYFDGTGDWLVMPSSPNLAFGTGNFTVEFWINSTSFASTPIYLDFRNTNGSASGLVFYVTTGGAPVVFISSAIITGSSTMSTATFYHIAVVRSGSTITCYLNGTSVGSASNSTNLSDSKLTIGSAVSNTNLVTGYIDDLRITKGYARYTANFTAPTAPFPDF